MGNHEKLWKMKNKIQDWESHGKRQFGENVMEKSLNFEFL